MASPHSKSKKYQRTAGKKDERKTFHVAIGGQMLVEFELLLLKEDCSANKLLNDMVKEGVKSRQKKAGTA